MELHTNKSSLLRNVVDEDAFSHIISLFPFEVDEIEWGSRYIGYQLDPNNYKITD